jgi:DDE superfamily endonuclease
MIMILEKDFSDPTALRTRQLFSSLPRSDQRRWAEVFIRGLLSVPGRKTIKKISDQVAGGGAEQCLQQFVSQSTWRWDTVRRDLAAWLCEELEPRAWVIKEAVLPKNGSNSVGVGRQFACTEGRVLNCQLAVGLFLAGDGWSCPVNWRLVLPRCWDQDSVRRKKAHLPDTERAVPRWQHMVDAIDEMAVDWGLRPLPVIADMSQQTDLDPLLSGLEERHLDYVVRVGSHQSAVTVRSAQGKLQTLSFAQFISDSLTRNTTTLNVWALPADRPGRVQLIGARIPPSAGPAAAPGGLPSIAAGRRRATRYVVAEWLPSRRSPRMTWVTSSGPRQITDLMAAAVLDRQATADLGELYDSLGFRHFEGRSYAGWHHYATLASAAYACRPVPGMPDVSGVRAEQHRTA